MESKYPPIVQVNETGTVIGPISYSKAHTKPFSGIWHQSASILIFEDDSMERFLSTKRSGKINSGGRWDISAGGHSIYLPTEKPQTPEQTIFDEVTEELFNHDQIPKNFVGLELIARFQKSLRLHDLEHCSLFKGVCKGPFKLGDEVTANRFITPEEFLMDSKANPDKYTKSSPFFVQKYLDTVE
jgi:isopentenyldiphosphate isomerase